MKITVLFGSPRRDGNTAGLTGAFLEECAGLGVETRLVSLYGRDLSPCLGCMACQDVMDGPGCVQEDDFPSVFRAMEDCDVIVLATPIYAWYCTAPMKALMDRAIYAGRKKYGAEKGPALLAGKKADSIVTCGCRPEEGADLWEAGLKRWCRYGGLDYLGLLCRRDLGRSVPFLDGEKEQAARDFAQAVYLAVKTEGL